MDGLECEIGRLRQGALSLAEGGDTLFDKPNRLI